MLSENSSNNQNSKCDTCSNYELIEEMDDSRLYYTQEEDDDDDFGYFIEEGDEDYFEDEEIDPLFKGSI